LLFMHWRVPAESLRPLSPPQLEIDTHDGSAWIGLVPFTMRDVNLAPLPLGSWNGITAFHECNVRTYVRCAGEPGVPGLPGVWFFSLDAASRLAVWGARKFFHLPYFYSRMDLQREGDRIDYAVQRIDHPRASMRCSWEAGPPLAASRDGDLQFFLTERYALYSADPGGRIYRGPIWHERWSLREAQLLHLEDTLVAAAGVQVEGPPATLHHADFISTRAWNLQPIKGVNADNRRESL
jgi:uncharacterized protein YqjF (DUF2071 family)